MILVTLLIMVALPMIMVALLIILVTLPVTLLDDDGDAAWLW